MPSATAPRRGRGVGGGARRRASTAPDVETIDGRARGCARTSPGARRGARRGHPGGGHAAAGAPRSRRSSVAEAILTTPRPAPQRLPGVEGAADRRAGRRARAQRVRPRRLRRRRPPASPCAGSSTRPRASCPDGDGERRGWAATLRRGVPDRASASAGTRRLPMPARTHPRLACAAVRIPSDTPPARPARRRRRISHRGRIILIAACGVAASPVPVGAGHRRLLDRLPLVRRARVRRGVPRPAAVARRPGRHLHGDLRRAAVRQPVGGRPARAEVPPARSGGAVPRALPG